jgi:hypothetical protein
LVMSVLHSYLLGPALPNTFFDALNRPGRY